MLSAMVSRRTVLLSTGLAVPAVMAAAAAGDLAAPSGDGHGPADAPTELRVATGPEGAVYRAIGGKLVEVLAQRFPRTRVREIQTGASVDNLDLLAKTGTDLAFASLDAIVDGLATGQPRDTTAVARLYDSWLHLVVLGGSPVRRLTDLHGRRVASGAAGSGTRFTARRLVAVSGVRPELVVASQTESATLLATGKVDAMLSLTGVPTPAITELARTRPVQLIALDGYAEAMADRYGDLYPPATLPAAMYPGVLAVGTLTIPNLLLARPGLPTDVVELVAKTLFAERARIAVGHPDANRINLRTGISTGPVRLHPGALRYYRSVKS
jgi:TRAP transporter TAXI family solute receptor